MNPKPLAFQKIEDLQTLQDTLANLGEDSWTIGCLGGRKITIQDNEYTMNAVLYKLLDLYNRHESKTFFLEFEKTFNQVKKLDQDGDKKLRKANVFKQTTTEFRKFFGNTVFSSRFLFRKSRAEVFTTVEKKIEERVKRAKRTVAERLKDNLTEAIEDQKRQPPHEHSRFYTGCKNISLTDLKNISSAFPTINGRTIGIAYTKGKRSAMEDKHLYQTLSLQIGKKEVACELYGVFDGHDGSQASDYVSKNLPNILIEQFQTQDKDDQTKEEVIWHALKEAFKQVDLDFKKTEPYSGVGTTATVALVINKEIWVANTGDSRTIFVDKKKTTQLTLDQTPDREKYERMVKRGGGTISDFGSDGIRVVKEGQTLAMARRIGGDQFGMGVIPNPTITHYDVSEDGHLLLFCDGLLECNKHLFGILLTPSSEIGRAVKSLAKIGTSAEGIAQKLVGTALNKFGSEDNISCLVVPIKA